MSRKRGEAALVLLDGDDAGRAFEKQRPGEAAGPRANFDDGRSFERSGGAGDAAGEIEIEQEILAEALARAKPRGADDVAERRQPVRRAQGAGVRAWRCMASASRKASIRLRGLALPVPASANAVPWSGEVRTKGSPSVTLTPSVEGERLDRDERLVVIHGHSHVVGLARRGVEQGVGGIGAGHVEALAPGRRDGGHDDVDLLAAHGAVFSGMGIEAGDGDARPRHAEIARKVARRDLERLDDASLVERAITSFSGIWMVTGTTFSSGRREHHHRVGGIEPGERGEKFGVARESRSPRGSGSPC